ncbi:hypothetical protein ACFY00_37375 [Kitasatospora sp. NPDC001540]|uniref:hypothetical protein n=1 Tax=Kitasatospora sp. NPDC001540 TaxID=3364014 RepID=UPI0036C5C52D
MKISYGNYFSWVTYPMAAAVREREERRAADVAEAVDAAHRAAGAHALLDAVPEQEQPGAEPLPQDAGEAGREDGPGRRVLRQTAAAARERAGCRAAVAAVGTSFLCSTRTALPLSTCHGVHWIRHERTRTRQQHRRHLDFRPGDRFYASRRVPDLRMLIQSGGDVTEPSRKMQKELARAGYRTTSEVEFGEETVFLWHPAYHDGFMAIGWAVGHAGGWGAYGRKDNGDGVRLGHASNLDQAFVAIIEWAAEHGQV